MKKTKNKLVTIILLFATSYLSAQITNTWAKRIGSSIDEDSRAIASDSNGNIYIGGSFQGTTDFDPSAAVFNLTSAGGDDGFLAKYDANGNFLSVLTFTNNLFCKIFAINIDNNNNVLITGGYSGTVDFDPGVGTSIYTAGSSGTNIFIVKINANGTHAWSKDIGVASLDDYGIGIAHDASNNVLVTGYFQGSNVDFDPGVGTYLLNVSGSNKKVFVLKLDGLGNFVWAFPIGASGSSAVGQTIAVDASNNVYIGGYFTGTSDFDPGIATTLLSPSGTYDAFVAKYTSLGVYAWAVKYSGALLENVLALDVDLSGNVYSTGLFSGNVDFDPSATSYTLNSVGASDDIFVVKLNTVGSFQWAKSIGNAGDDEGTCIALTGNTIYISGSFENNVDFDPSAATYSLNSSGAKDVFVLGLDYNGNFSTAFSFGGLGTDYGRGIAVLTNTILCSGSFNSTCDFDPSLATNNISSAGAYDAFISKYVIANISTEIKETEYVSIVAIYPNPCSNKFILKTLTSDSYVLYNALGETMMTFKSNHLEETIDVSVLPDGIYYLNGTKSVKKIIISK